MSMICPASEGIAIASPPVFPVVLPFMLNDAKPGSDKSMVVVSLSVPSIVF